ncbi:unnamed protein product [Protopolystoma xenopodis]|uniref:Uncharacterized protein n=1 Tax=Protopolystoma xenopodis TaxID=117903 RepID=A0A3S5CKZ7_9PLAT|nr:unnamed protein product [Protopolystoma xenopodis]
MLLLLYRLTTSGTERGAQTEPGGACSNGTDPRIHFASQPPELSGSKPRSTQHPSSFAWPPSGFISVGWGVIRKLELPGREDPFENHLSPNRPLKYPKHSNIWYIFCQAREACNKSDFYPLHFNASLPG